ncbi:uncharacterized protein F5147DRAFT_718209 [Suillus discolor]|uniref:Uncharacterized protein n=1 Tax=Suillus discolor TaxID=1912936 RepID=A0A9P7EY15_9AGAM|nr:uncharacterized protein F5147DRAFT_718209 [Suillus discolor]KAG2095428.1 hypothetical protein F5147DRAFT_718209 [Suillus discolor]
MNNDIPALDCPAVVNDLAERLGSLSRFLDGINDLMKFSCLGDHELQHYSRKIIALTEGARMTLRREGVALYLFVICSEELLPYKSAYFKFLLWIRHRRPAFPADIGDRIASLLSVLKTDFTIRFGGVDTRAQLGIEELLVPNNALTPCETVIQTAAHAHAAIALSPQKSYATSDAMLLPDALAKNKQRIHRLARYVKSPAANTPPPVSRQYLPSNNWEAPRLRRPFVRTKAIRCEVVPESQSLLEDEDWEAICCEAVPDNQSSLEDLFMLD